MKHFYFKKRTMCIFLCLLLSTMTTFGQQTLDYLTNNKIVAAENAVPDDWQNDLWVNKDFVELAVGDSHEIWARRLPEIIDGPISNNVQLPIYNFVIVEGNSVSVDQQGVVTANSQGKSIIKVTYNEKEAYGRHYGPVSRVNVTYVVVNVTDQSAGNIDITNDLTSSSYDTYYFSEENYILPLSVAAENATSLKVYCNGTVVSKDGEKYPLILENRANIIEVVASNGVNEKYWARVIDARKIEVDINNLSSPGQPIFLTHKVEVGFRGIVLPLPKLATFYNPCTSFGFGWGDEDKTKVIYSLDNNEVIKSNDPQLGQYALADHNKIIFNVNKVGRIVLSNGHIKEYWWGEALGEDKKYKGKISAGLGSPTRNGDFSFFPDITIDVAAPYRSVTFEDIDLEGKDHTMVATPESFKDFSKVYTSGSYSFKLFANDMNLTFPVWSGLIVTNKSDNITIGGVGNQLNSAAGGDVSGVGNYGVIYSANSGGMPHSDTKEISFEVDKAHAPHRVQGCYVTNNTYAVHSMGSFQDLMGNHIKKNNAYSPF
ncbi:DUF4465 domain-containing protein [Halosquirtibacter xylanolyticus]|uniref:DUF4465 domain-containing protein n=1 Tax=Halosquirtibacter xylanolyticus TaxID=3374599 RepID=UPI0037491F26|nr:DUF4465 domain-containing protein [Prolixibacteraceae bacterium]